MPDFAHVLADVVVGRAREIRRDYLMDVAATIATAYIEVKVAATDVDSAAIITKTITTTATANGQITADGSGGTCSLFFSLTDGDTALLVSGTTYEYEILLVTSGGQGYTPELGTVTPVARLILSHP